MTTTLRSTFVLSLLLLSACAPSPEAETTTDTPAEAQEQENPDGNVGAACSTAADCQTPMDYLVRSSCPFTSACIEGRCAVICPMWQDEPNPQTGQSDTVQCSADSECSCDRWPGAASGRCECVNGACATIMEE